MLWKIQKTHRKWDNMQIEQSHVTHEWRYNNFCVDSDKELQKHKFTHPRKACGLDKIFTVFFLI